MCPILFLFEVSWMFWKGTKYCQSEDKREESKYFQDKIAECCLMLYALGTKCVE